jgi:UPF0716 family protein affecting phage T7 exclusion
MDNTLAVISLIGVIVGVTLLLVSLIVGVTLVAADHWRHLAKTPEVPRTSSEAQSECLRSSSRMKTASTSSRS